jgi:hypothetical protein
MTCDYTGARRRPDEVPTHPVPRRVDALIKHPRVVLRHCTAVRGCRYQVKMR